jgi:hypothetical protein
MTALPHLMKLVDAQQNLYNVGYDLAVILAVLGQTTTDEDIVTEKLSIGCDATTRTSFDPALTGSEPGFDGHNKSANPTPHPLGIIIFWQTETTTPSAVPSLA